MAGTCHPWISGLEARTSCPEFGGLHSQTSPANPCRSCTHASHVSCGRTSGGNSGELWTSPNSHQLATNLQTVVEAAPGLSWSIPERIRSIRISTYLHMFDNFYTMRVLALQKYTHIARSPSYNICQVAVLLTHCSIEHRLWASSTWVQPVYTTINI